MRWLLPALLILIWLVVGGVGGPFAGKLSEVAENDNSAFLPETAESTDVAVAHRLFTDEQLVPAIVVAERVGGTTPADQRFLADTSADFAGVRGVTGAVSPPLPADDGEAVQLIVPIDSGVDPGVAVERIRELVATDPPAGLTVLVTGPGRVGR